MTKWIISGIVALLVISGGLFFVVNNKKTPEPTTVTPSSQKTSNSSTNTTTNNPTVAATITYSNSGFSPATTTVKSGDTVAITNTSSGTLQYDSDPHPQHTDDTDLNVGTVAPGITKTFVVTKTGKFGFHNHLNPSNMGAIIVQ